MQRRNKVSGNPICTPSQLLCFKMQACERRTYLHVAHFGTCTFFFFKSCKVACRSLIRRRAFLGELSLKSVKQVQSPPPRPHPPPFLLLCRQPSEQLRLSWQQNNSRQESWKPRLLTAALCEISTALVAMACTRAAGPGGDLVVGGGAATQGDQPAASK